MSADLSVQFRLNDTIVVVLIIDRTFARGPSNDKLIYERRWPAQTEAERERNR